MQLNKHTRSLGFVAVLIVTGYFSFLVMKPYVAVLFIAWLYAILVYPLYDLLIRRLNWNKRIITLLTIMVSLVLVVIPLALILVVAVNQLGQMIGTISQGLPELSVNYFITEFNALTGQIPIVDFRLSPAATENYIAQLADFIARNTVSLVRGISTYSVAFITEILLLFIVLFALLPNFELLGSYLKKISPLSPRATSLFMRRSRVMLVDTVKATVVIAFVQALISGVFFLILGVPYALVWTVFILLTALIPVIGSAMVTIPMTLVYAAMGNWPVALLVFLWQILVIANVDNVVRPKMVSEEARVPGVLMLVAVLGGLKAFGLLGIFYGPLAVGLFLAALEVYIEEYQSDTYHD
jgi:predicted PurR-regulated permease PerM